MMRNKRNLKQEDFVDKDEFRSEFQITQELLFPEDRGKKRDKSSPPTATAKDARRQF